MKKTIALITLIAGTLLAQPYKTLEINSEWQQNQALPDINLLQGANANLRIVLSQDNYFADVTNLIARFEARQTLTSTNYYMAESNWTSNDIHTINIPLDSGQTGDVLTNYQYSIIIVDGAYEYPMGIGDYSTIASSFAGAGSVLNGSPGYVTTNIFVQGTNNLMLEIEILIDALPTFSDVSNIVDNATAPLATTNQLNDAIADVEVDVDLTGYASLTNDNIFTAQQNIYNNLVISNGNLVVGDGGASNGGISLGDGSYTEDYGVAIGNGAYSVVGGGVAIGSGAGVEEFASDAVALGKGAIATVAGEMILGSTYVPKMYLTANNEIKFTTVFDDITINTGLGAFIVNNETNATMNDIDDAIGNIDIPPANYFNSVTEESGTIITLTTNQIAYAITLTNDTTIIFPEVVGVAGCILVDLVHDSNTVYDVTLSNANWTGWSEWVTNTTSKGIGTVNNKIPWSFGIYATEDN